MQKLTDSFKPVKNHPQAFVSSDGEFLIRNRPEQQPGTREVHLSDLGQFPLAEEDIPLLKQELEFDKIKLKVPEILQRSNIPIFYAEGERYPAYIPKPSVAICRYFAAMWGAEGDESGALVKGFLIIDSFVGGFE